VSAPAHRVDHLDGVDVVKLGRMHALVARLLDELHDCPLDAPARRRLQRLGHSLLVEVGSALNDALLEELGRLAVLSDLDEPSAAELRVIDAQLLGWLNGVSLGESLGAGAAT
jgi:hypothetical protein